jgi:hypothetical protein
MSTGKWLVPTAMAIACAFVAFRAARADGGGGPGRIHRFEGFVRASVEGGRVELNVSADVDPISFRLNAVNGKYRLVQFEARNGGDKPVTLSADADRLEMVLASGSVVANLNPRKTDTEWWDALPKELREALAYPKSISSERRVLYVLFPMTDAAASPSSFRYTIASLGGPIVEIRVPATKP